MSSGWKFPFCISEEDGRVEISETKENIRESVKIILITEPGERLFHPEFGTRLRQFLFESIGSQTSEMIRREVIHSLKMWEKRISDISVETDMSTEKQGILNVTVSYRITDSGEEDTVEVMLG